MTEDTKTTDAEALRQNTAEAAPEVAEHEAMTGRVAELENQLADAKQQVLYAQAEIQNVRRRAEKEIADARAYSTTSFARDILSVADNLARGLSAIPAELRADEKLKGLTYATITPEQKAEVHRGESTWDFVHSGIVLMIVAGIYLYFW